MRSRYLMIISIVAILAGLGLKLQTKTPSGEKKRTVASSVEKTEPAAREGQSKSLEKKSEASGNSVTLVKPIHSESHKVWKEFKYMQELTSYANLSEKVLLRDEDQEIKRQLFKNTDFLKSLQSLLTTPPVDNESRIRQNLALDFVLEALKTDLKEHAIEILQNVAADSTLESSTLSLDDRKALAGLKAEALHNWSSLDPSSVADIQRLLPGPVSQKIWANVKLQQESNLAESSLLKINR